MTEMFAGEELGGSKPPLVLVPPIPPDLARRLRTLGIAVTGLTWNGHFKHWTFTLRGPFGPRGQIATLAKTISGVWATARLMEVRQ